MAMALLFIASLPISAFAEEYDLANGSIEVSATENGHNVTQSGSTTENDKNVVITSNGQETTNTVTIKAESGATANVTLKDVNIDVSGGYLGKAAVSTEGDGDVTIELDNANKVKSGTNHAGVEKNNGGNLTITDANDTKGSLDAQGGLGGAGIGSGSKDPTATEKIVSDITISGGTVTATGGDYGAGIGGGQGASASKITISGGEVTAKGGNGGAGIGGGQGASASKITISGGEVTAKGGNGGAGIGCGVYKENGCESITVSGDAQVKVQGGSNYSGYPDAGCGAAIGNGGTSQGEGTGIKELNDSKLTTKGTIKYYNPDDDMSTATPRHTIIGKYVPSDDDKKPDKKTEAKTVSQTTSPAENSYSVVDNDGKSIGYKTEVKDGVLTVTVDGDYAVLTGTAANIAALTAQGVTTAVFVTSGATSTFDLADLSAKGSGTYKLTHDGATVTFTLDATDISEILK